MGMCGILITTNDQEKLCVSEAYNILNEVCACVVCHELSLSCSQFSKW